MSITKMIKTAALALVLGASAPAQERAVTIGPKMIEIAYSTSGQRTRLYTSANIGGLIGYSGLNEITSGKPETYFGNNQLYLARATGPVVAMQSTLDSTVVRAGVRDTHMQKALKGYGWTTLTAGAGDARLTMFHGQPLPGKMSLEAFQVVSKPYGYAVKTATQLQLNKDVSNIAKRITGGHVGGLEVFARGEFVNAGQSPTFLLGVRKTFK